MRRQDSPLGNQPKKRGYEGTKSWGDLSGWQDLEKALECVASTTCLNCTSLVSGRHFTRNHPSFPHQKTTTSTRQRATCVC